MTVEDKKVLVTGGTSRIGESTARAYAAAGADVVITGTGPSGSFLVTVST